MEPKWEALARHLRQRVSVGDYESYLPSEAALIAEHSVSRGTVRRALESLEAEGLITSAQGQQRRVRQIHKWSWPMHVWERSHNTTEDAWAAAVRAQGGEPETDVVVSVEPATDGVAAALRLAPGGAVAVRRRVRSVNGEPHQFADSYFPSSIAEEHPVFLGHGDRSAPEGLLAQAGYIQARFADKIEARMPTPDESRILRLPSGVPLLVHQRTGYTSGGQAVRHMVSRMGADRVEVTYELDA